jgi:hypothetical protein
MPSPAFLLCPQSGLILLLIQQAQLLSFRTMGFRGFSFSVDLPAIISRVILSSSENGHSIASAMIYLHFRLQRTRIISGDTPRSRVNGKNTKGRSLNATATFSLTFH